MTPLSSLLNWEKMSKVQDKKDNIFLNQEGRGDFQFNYRVAEVFEDMLKRSVPCYSHVIEMTAKILDKFLVSEDTIYDLGSSTGTTLIELARRLDHLNLTFTGFDNSPAMVEKAALKAEMYSKTDRLGFFEKDITQLDLENGGAVILNYTMQFIKPEVREEFLKKVHGFLRPGGILVMSEKVIVDDSELNAGFLELYHDYKRTMGYSEIEIANKRDALENVLIPLSSEQNAGFLRKAGFVSVQPFFQWFNFVSFIAIKS